MTFNIVSHSSLRQANPHAFDFIPPGKHRKILDHTSDYPAASDLQKGFNQAQGRKFDVPGGRYMIDQTVTMRTGTQLRGGGTQERALSNSPKTGTQFVPPPDLSGFIGQRWFDVADVGDPVDYKPLLVVGGPQCSIQDFATVAPRTGPGRLDCGIFVATVYQTYMSNVQTLGGWKDAGLRLDNSAQPDNVLMTGLHPDIVYSRGLQEFTAIGCNFVGVRGVRLQGTTRPGNYPADTDWYWGGAGASDITFVGTRFDNSNTEGNVGEQDVYGAALWIDAATNSNPFNAVQGQRFIGCNFRTDDSKYNVFLDRCNRVEFFGCYHETEEDPSEPYGRFETSSRTGSVLIVGGYLAKINWWRDNADSSVPARDPPPYDNMTFLNYEGDFKLPILPDSAVGIPKGSFYRESSASGRVLQDIA